MSIIPSTKYPTSIDLLVRLRKKNCFSSVVVWSFVEGTKNVLSVKVLSKRTVSVPVIYVRLWLGFSEMTRSLFSATVSFPTHWF